MFSKQRRNYRIFIYVALVVALCVLIVLLFWPKEPDAYIYEDKGNENTNLKEEQAYHYDEDSEEEKKEETEDDFVVNKALETYYLVKNDGDSVKVFFSDKYGDLIELESTDIIYELLPVEDQSRFDEGIKVQTQEELSSLLMNYES